LEGNVEGNDWKGMIGRECWKGMLEGDRATINDSVELENFCVLDNHTHPKNIFL
jgi:hypothetical protein